jgi:anti-sigma-K factor RskA
MNGHPQFEEDFDLYVLGTLDADEMLAMASHVKSCAECAEKLVTARGRVASFGYAAPPADPPARVKQRLMSRVQGTSAARRGSSLVTFWRRPAPAWVFAAAIAILCVGLAAENQRLNQQTRALQADAQRQEIAMAQALAVLDLLTAPDTQGIALTAANAKPLPGGRVFYHPSRGLLFYAANLSAPPAGRTYQLWLIPTQGSPISAGVFEPDQKGSASIILPKLPGGVAAKAFAVTVEPAGGVPQPTGAMVLIGAV